MLTLIGWQSSTITKLTQDLPLQTYDSATILVSSYLASVGGWNPADPAAPTGEGEPVNGDTPESASAAIAQAQVDRVYRMRGTVNIAVDVDYMINLVTGTSDADVISQMQPLIEEFVKNHLEKTPLVFNEMTTVVGDVTRTGHIDGPQRAELHASVIADSYTHDPRAVALAAARRAYSLSNSWNVQYVYMQPDTAIVVVLREYTDDVSFVSLELSTLEQYVINVDPMDYSIAGGTVRPIIS